MNAEDAQAEEDSRRLAAMQPYLDDVERTMQRRWFRRLVAEVKAEVAKSDHQRNEVPNEPDRNT